MVRPRKVGLDYFPMDVDMDQDDKLYVVIADYGWVGFAIVIKILMEIYKEGYFIEWDERKAKIFSRKNLFNLGEVNDVINLCLQEDLFSNNLYKEHQVLTSKGIQKRYLEATTRRKNVQVFKEYLLIELSEVNNNNLDIVNVDINSSSTSENEGKSTQSIVEHSKAEQSKEIVEEKKEQQESPPATTTDAIVFYQNNIGMIRPAIAEEMLDWINDFGDQMVIHALNISLERNKPNWGYAKAILKSWHDKGIKTMEQVKAEEVAFQNNQAQRRPFNQSHQPSVPEPDWFRNGEHERKAEEQNGSNSADMTEEQSKVAQLLQQYQQQAE